jgi:membrane fusion protein (multidrug efflux system)
MRPAPDTQHRSPPVSRIENAAWPQRLIAAASALVLLACSDGASAPAKQGAREHLVEIARVETGALAYPAERSGNLRALREARIANEEAGRILRLSVREGDRVAAGTVLVQYDDALLRAELDKARAAAELARSEQRRAEDLVARGFVSAEAETRARATLQIAEAEQRRLETRLGYMTLRAPFAGVIAARHAEPGDATAVHTQLLTLIDLSQLITDVSVPEGLLATLRPGGSAGVRIDALGETLHPGRIARIHPGIDPQTRMGLVEVALDPLPAGARPGQFCRVVLQAGTTERLIAPLAAIQRDAREEFVFVYRPGDGAGDQGAGKVERRAIRSGLRLADRVEILDGVAAGDSVVIKGFLGLAAGKAVRAVAAPAAG